MYSPSITTRYTRLDDLVFVYSNAPAEHLFTFPHLLSRARLWQYRGRCEYPRACFRIREEKPCCSDLESKKEHEVVGYGRVSSIIARLGRARF